MTKAGSKLPVCALIAVTLFCAQTGFSAPGDAGTSGANPRWSLPADIPTGLADNNPQTSQAVTTLLNLSAIAYADTKALHAEGSYIGVTKSTDDETSHLSAKVTLNYLAPGRLSVRTVGDTPLHTTAFVANGDTVSMDWGEATTSSVVRQYFTMPQPDSLSAFTADHRRGELYEDRADVLGMAVIPQLLVGEDTLRVFTSNVSDYVYEGVEEVSGHKCHRLRFRQTSPRAIVILWIDAETYIIRKSSIIRSFDSDYSMVESFEEGTYAEMMVMAWDDLTTDPARVSVDAFQWQTPEDAKKDALTEPSAWALSLTQGEERSLWESLVATAAEAPNQSTTFSLIKQQGAAELELTKLVELEAAPLEIEGRRLPGESADSLIVAMKDGTVSIRDFGGKEKSRFSIGMQPSEFDCMETTGGELLYVLALDQKREVLSAFDLTGKKIWDYSYPYASILGFDAGIADPCVYVSLDTTLGLRKLNADGQVVYGARTTTVFPALTAVEPASNRVIGYSPLSTIVFDHSLIKQDDLEADETVKFVQWDDINRDAPFVTFSINSEDDALVHRRRPSGDVVWTVTVAPKQEDMDGGACVPIKLHLDGEIRRVWLAVTTAGHILVLDESGEVLYRGQVTADAATVERNGGGIINHVAAADLDGDGAEEFYLKLDTHLLRLSTR